MTKMAEFGKRPEHRVYQRRINKKDQEEDILVDGLDAAYAVADKTGSREYALVIWQVFAKNHRREKTILGVQSPYVLRAFRDVIKSHPSVPSNFEQPVELESPFQMLIHHWEDLDVYRKNTDDDDVRLHMGLLFDFMNSELGADRERLLASFESKTITYATLWSIFVPGRLLYLEDNGHPWLLRCNKTAYEEYTSAGKICHVYGQYTDYNGNIKGDATHKVDIKQKDCFGGDNPAVISSLPIYPIEYWSKDEDEISRLEEKLRARGRRFLSMRGIQLLHYDGLARYLKEPPYSFYHWSLEEISGYWLPFTESGRVVLDRILVDEEIALNRASVKKNDDADPLLAPPYAYGFSPSRKVWCRYYLDNLTDITWKDQAWDKLLLKEAQKLTLRALVESHVFPGNARDQAEQKGKGLVILLHGSPGSGKTLTAETSAEATKRLLLPSSLDELNKDNWPSEFEVRLKRLLQYGTRWNAVLLLDEADVFLERREDSPGSQQRNALVAVFLKHLEFFSGMVFLTTNRVKAFDPAMKSRIHLALGYGPPDIETRRQLWMQYLTPIPPEHIDMDTNEDIDELLTERLNGREIAYAVHTARTIARHKGEPLRLDHLRTVVQVRSEFDKSLQEIAQRMSGTGLDRKDSILHNDSADFRS
ncbi:P-loop containing nucleoside triphosphate hydrolase protein [Cladorrhinum sp. PSN332]|nr:P-loop containing nucleoside triphosphate hydrolase protein [Cladorrhinum sp. PSN332]